MKQLANEALMVIEERRRLESEAIVKGVIGDLLDKAFEQLDDNVAKRSMKKVANQAVTFVERKKNTRHVIVKSLPDELLETAFADVEIQEKLNANGRLISHIKGNGHWYNSFQSNSALYSDSSAHITMSFREKNSVTSK